MVIDELRSWSTLTCRILPKVDDEDVVVVVVVVVDVVGHFLVDADVSHPTQGR